MADASEGSAVVSVALSPDGSRVAIAGSNRADVFVWDSPLQQKLGMLKGDTASPVKSIAFAHDGNRIVTLSVGGRASIWDMESNEPLLVLPAPGFVAGPVLFTPHDSRLTTVQQNAIRLWEARSSYDPQATALVTALVDELGVSGEIVKRLDSEPGLTGEVRDAALRIVQSQGDNPSSLNTQSWEVVTKPNVDPAP